MFSQKSLLSLSATLLLLGTQAPAFALDPVIPNHYECEGKHISVTYDTKPETLSIKLGKTDHSASGEALESNAALFGDIKTLTIKFTPDVSIQKASIIVPYIVLGTNSLGNDIKKIKFNSQLIITTIATPFTGGPFIGLENGSKYYDLNCIGSLTTDAQ